MKSSLSLSSWTLSCAVQEVGGVKSSLSLSSWTLSCAVQEVGGGEV